MWGTSYFYCKLRSGNVASSLNRTDVESCGRPKGSDVDF